MPTRERCEGECGGQERVGVIERPNGKMLCSDCNLRRIREMSPTGLIRKLNLGGKR